MERYEKMEQKLYLPRFLEGGIDRRALAMVHEFEKAFREHHFFVGVAPFGSSFKGYSQELSDIDIRILVDTSQEVDPWEELRRFGAAADNFGVEMSKRYGRKVEVLVQDLMVERTLTDFESGQYQSWKNFQLLRLADLSGLVIGARAKELRLRIAEALHKIPLERQRFLMRKVLDFLMEEEKGSISADVTVKKMIERGVLPSEKEEEFFKAREELWKGRISRIWGVKGF